MTTLPAVDNKIRHSVVVARPRLSDGVGRALKDAFQHESRLPQEMTALLELLDKASEN